MFEVLLLPPHCTPACAGCFPSLPSLSRCAVPFLRSVAHIVALDPCCSPHDWMLKQPLPSSSLTSVAQMMDLPALLAHGPPPPAKVTAQHIQALRQDLRAETLSHAAALTAHTCVVLFGSSKFLGRDELSASRAHAA